MEFLLISIAIVLGLFFAGPLIAALIALPGVIVELVIRVFQGSKKG